MPRQNVRTAPQRRVRRKPVVRQRKPVYKPPAPARVVKRPKAAPYSLLDRVDRKRKRTVPVRKKSVKKLNRQTAQHRAARRYLNALEANAERPPTLGHGKLDLDFERDQLKAEHKTYKAALKLPPKAKLHELEKLYAGRVKRHKEREFENVDDDTRKKFGLAAKHKDFKIAGVNVEKAGRDYQKGVFRGAERVKRALNNSKYAGKRSGLSGDLSEKVTNDLVDVVAQAPTAAYAVTAAGVEAARGRPQRGKALFKEFKAHDPIALTVQGKPGKAWKEVKRHPGFAALEVAGAAGTVSRGAGAVGRSGVAGAGARRATSRTRAPKIAPGTRVTKPQQYPAGAVGKATVRTLEKGKVRKAKKLYRKAGQARNQGDVRGAAELRSQAQKKNPYRMTGQELKTRYDRLEGLSEPRRRLHRTQVDKRAAGALPDKHEGVALLLAQGVVKPTRESLQGYLSHIGKQKLTTKSEKGTNRELRGQIKKALDDPDLDLDLLHESGKAYAKVTAPLQRKLVEGGVLSREQERMAKLVPVAVREMGAKYNKDAGRLELGGEKLPVKRVERFLKSTGRDPKDIAFVTQHPSQTTAGAYYQSWQTPKGIRSEKRTGAATDRGTFAVSREVGKANAVKMQGLADAGDEFSRFIKEFGHRKGRKVQTFKNRADAEKALRDMSAAGGAYEWSAVAIKPMFGGGPQVRKLLDDANADVPRATVDAVHAALRGEQGAPGYALVPKPVADQMAQHLKVLDPSPGGKGLRGVTQQFKNVVLTTSPRWLTGNVVEAALRSLVDRAGPRSYKLGRQVLKELHTLDPKAAEELVIRLGEGHYGMQELQAIHTSLKSVADSKLEKPAQIAGTVRRAPVAKQIVDAGVKYKQTVFELNGRLEHQFKVAMLGRQVKRQMPQVKDRDFLNVRKAARQYAKGLTETNEQFQAAEAVRRAYGQYEAFSPTGRKLKAQYVPFIAWAANAVKFLVDVLPRDHPTIVALLAANQRATESWQTEQGYDVAPSWQKGTVPTKAGKRPLGRYTPFGLAADPLGTVAGQVLPQFSGTLMNLQGLDWTGKPLGGESSALNVPDSEKLSSAVKSLGGSFVPLFGQVERGPKSLNPIAPYAGTDPKVSRAFKREDEIAAELKKLPTLDEVKEGSSKWKRRTALNAEKNKLDLRIKKLSGGKWRKSAHKPKGRRKSGGGSDWSSGGGSSGGSDWSK